MKQFILTVFTVFIIGICCAEAQFSQKLMFGLKGGAALTKISGVKSMLITEENRPIYSLEDVYGICPQTDFVFLYQPKTSFAAARISVGYLQKKSELRKISPDEEEIFTVLLHNINFGLGANIYALKGFYGCD